jgi:ABC-2 type transport system ATP-binding protein
MSAIISIKDLTKTYAGGHQALKGINLEVEEGEILALLGPNGAGKTTLISTICGIITPTSGSVTVGGHDIVSDYRKTRSLIGLVPQELTLGNFERVFDTVAFTRGLFNKPDDPQLIDELLKELSLFDKKDSLLRALSGGMKRRVLIAKALCHEPKILFLDEPTAGVDVELRKDMWRIVEKLRQSGVTIILTTHYIEEAEEIADRVGVINGGEMILIEDKDQLMTKMGRKELEVQLREPIKQLPTGLESFDLSLSDDGKSLVYSYDTKGDSTGITPLLQAINKHGLQLKDIKTSQTSLEEIFVDLVNK